MILRPALAGSIGVLLVALPAPGDDDLEGFEDRRVVRALRLLPDEVIDLDGHLDDAVWDRAEPATDFLQQEPDNGAPSTERTEVRLAFDSGRLYIGVRCLDSEPDQLLGNQMQRDAPFSADDRFMWSLDTYLDERSGYFFEINPSGAMGDGLINTAEFGGFANKAWDGIWTARVRRTAVGWTAEIEIPFATLNFDPEAPAWGANFQRTIRRKNEESRWNGYSRNQGLTQMSTAGLIVGLEDISQGVGLDVKPYLVGGFSESPIEDRPRAYTGGRGSGFLLQRHPTASRKLHSEHRLCGDRGRPASDQPHTLPAVLPRKKRLLSGRIQFLPVLAPQRCESVLQPPNRVGCRRPPAEDRLRAEADRSGWRAGCRRPPGSDRAVGPAARGRLFRSSA